MCYTVGMKFNDFVSELPNHVVGYEPLLQLSSWSERPLTFPAHHLKGGAMALPFTPTDYVYSPPVEMSLKSPAELKYWAYYQRGGS